MIFKFLDKWKDTYTGVRFVESRSGGIAVDRKSLHESPGYKRQLEALERITAWMEKRDQAEKQKLDREP